MNRLSKTSLSVILGIISIFGLQAIAADGLDSQKTLLLRAETSGANMEMVVKDNFVKAKYASAENRFLQGNVKASHSDFSDLISKASHDDYVFLSYGIKMAEYGFI